MDSQKIAKLVEKYGAEAYTKLKDPIFFINEIIGFESGDNSKLTVYQEEWLRLVETNDRLNLSAFRSSGKTETLFCNYPIFKAFTQSGWQGILVSNSLKQSVSILRRIRQKILENELLRTSIPTGKDGLWSKTELQLKNNSIIWSRPNNENLPGEHVDFVGMDEIGYWKDMDIITKVIPPMLLAKKGKLVGLGTTVSQIDPIHQLRKNPVFLSKFYPANAIEPVSGKCLLEVRYPNRKYEEIKKEYDSMSWSREFLLKPLGAKDRIYPYELISACFNDDCKFEYTKRLDCAYYMGLDFALSGEAGADYTVYTVLEKKGDTMRIVNIERFKGLSYQAQKVRIKALYDLYKPVKVTVDEGSFGKSFIDDLRVEHVPVEGFIFTNQSKQELHSNLRNMFEQKRLVVPQDKDDLKTRALIEDLIKELLSFGIMYDQAKMKVTFEGLGEHDDMVNSLALACWAARGIGNLTWTVGRGSSRPSGVFLIAKT